VSSYHLTVSVSKKRPRTIVVGGGVEIVLGVLLHSHLLERAGRQVRGVLCYGVKLLRTLEGEKKCCFPPAH
jgi:hypothetical protein